MRNIYHAEISVVYCYIRVCTDVSLRLHPCVGMSNFVGAHFVPSTTINVHYDSATISICHIDFRQWDCFSDFIFIQYISFLFVSTPTTLLLQQPFFSHFEVTRTCKTSFINLFIIGKVSVTDWEYIAPSIPRNLQMLQNQPTKGDRKV